MSEKQDSLRDEELEAPFHTILGVGAILFIVAFVGFARTRNSTTPEPVKTTVAIEQLGESRRTEHPALNVEQSVSPAMENAAVPSELQNAIAKVNIKVPADSREIVEAAGVRGELPYGKDAVDRCAKACGTDAACGTGCFRLMPSEFARRILPADLDISKLVGRTHASCKKVVISEKVKLNGDDRAGIEHLLEPPQFYDRGILQERAAFQLFGALRPAEKGTPLAETLCLLDAATSTQLAIADAAGAKDSYSEMFYRRVEGELLALVAGLRNSITPELNG